MLRVLERFTYPLAVLTAALGLVYWYWTTTPSYTVAAVAISIKNRDQDTFQKYVDIDSVVSHAFDDVVDGPARPVVLGRADALPGLEFAKYFKREIIALVHSRMVSFVKEGYLQLNAEPAVLIPGSGIVYTQGVTTASPLGPGHMPALSEDVVNIPDLPDTTRMLLREYGLTSQGFHGIEYMKMNGSIGTLGLEFYAPKLRSSYVVDLKLEEVGGYWRITQVTNLNQLIAKYINSRKTA